MPKADDPDRPGVTVRRSSYMTAGLGLIVLGCVLYLLQNPGLFHYTGLAAALVGLGLLAHGDWTARSGQPLIPWLGLPKSYPELLVLVTGLGALLGWRSEVVRFVCTGHSGHSVGSMEAIIVCSSVLLPFVVLGAATKAGKCFDRLFRCHLIVLGLGSPVGLFSLVGAFTNP